MQGKNLGIICLVLLLSNCTKPNTNEVAIHSGFNQAYIQTTPFKLASYQKIKQVGQPVNIYIEGDGRAWINHSRLSRDPSPRTATVMQMAAIDPNPNVVYLARPCQYSPDDLSSICEEKYWSLARYSLVVVAAIDQAISKIKQLAKAHQVNLIGYSGGATLAVLVAAQRHDIASIRTVAGNLDLLAMQKHHRTTPLSESLDPINVAKDTKHIPQLHFVGAKDQIVPLHIARNFCQAAGIDQQHIVILPQASHSDGWVDQWPQLLEQIP